MTDEESTIARAADDDHGVAEHRAHVRDDAAAGNGLAVISNCPQTRNPCNGFNPTPIRVVVGSAG